MPSVDYADEGRLGIFRHQRLPAPAGLRDRGRRKLVEDRLAEAAERRAAPQKMRQRVAFAFAPLLRGQANPPDSARHAPRFDDESVRPFLRDASGQAAGLVLGDERQGGAGRKSIEGLADEVGSVPNGQAPEVDFRRIRHAGHVLAERSALLLEEPPERT